MFNYKTVYLKLTKKTIFPKTRLYILIFTSKTAYFKELNCFAFYKKNKQKSK